jgi:flavodoxin I
LVCPGAFQGKQKKRFIVYLKNSSMKKIGIFFGSSTGNTEYVAEMIKNELGENAELVNVDSAEKSDMDKYDMLVFGTSTWGIGDAQDDWEDYLQEISAYDFSGKTVALFGLGDQDTYPESFLDGMGVLYDFLKKRKAKIIGSWPTDGYNFERSEAVKSGKFVGLAIDQEYQEDLTAERIKKWVSQIK